MRARKVDDNQQMVVKQLRGIGASVAITSMLGQGFPDFVVGYRKRNFLIELKDERKSPSARKLTPDEIEWHKEWKGQINTCICFHDILKIITQE